MKARSARGIVILFLMSAFGLGPANAQQQKPPSEALPPPHPAIEQAALDMLKATTQRLANAKTLSFTVVTTYESPARNGQPLYYTTLSQVAVSRPNELRVITPGDGPASDFYYNGKTMMAYAPDANLIAVTDAPSTIEATMKEAYDKAAIYFPFAEIITDDACRNLSEGLTYAFVVGQSHVVDGIVTDIVAISNANVEAEIWIGVDDGLPRMIRAVYPKDPTDSRYEIEFTHWQLNVPFKRADFTSAAASGGHWGAESNGQYAYGSHYTGTTGYAGAYHPPAVVNQYYGTGCYNCGGWSGAAVAGASMAAAVTSANTAYAYSVGDVYAALPAGCGYASYGGGAYYDCRGTWFTAAYGANGVYHRVVPTP